MKKNKAEGKMKDNENKMMEMFKKKREEKQGKEKKIGLACDHAGFEYKEKLKKYLI